MWSESLTTTDSLHTVRFAKVSTKLVHLKVISSFLTISCTYSLHLPPKYRSLGVLNNNTSYHVTQALSNIDRNTTAKTTATSLRHHYLFWFIYIDCWVFLWKKRKRNKKQQLEISLNVINYPHHKHLYPRANNCASCKLSHTKNTLHMSIFDFDRKVEVLLQSNDMYSKQQLSCLLQ